MGFIVGAAVGMAVGLLLAPKPGTEIRKTIRQQVGQGYLRFRWVPDDPS